MATHKDFELQNDKLQRIIREVDAAESLVGRLKQRWEDLKSGLDSINSNVLFLRDHSPIVSLDEFRRIQAARLGLTKEMNDIFAETKKLDAIIKNFKVQIKREQEITENMFDELRRKVVNLRRKRA